MPSLEEHQLQTQIAAHLRAALRLRVDLNACASINRLLPSHLLALIFTHQATAIQEDNLLQFSVDSCYPNNERDVHKPIYAWLNVARVCRRWREVALGCPQLWTFVTIDQRIPLWVFNRFDVRSEGRPLHVVVHEVHHHGDHCGRCGMSESDSDATSLNHTAGLGMLRRIIDRTVRLSIFLEDLRYFDLWAAFEHEARCLESLRVVSIGSGSLHEPTSGDIPGIRMSFIPTALFTSRTPVLTSLFLKGVEFTLDNTLFCASLRHLDVSRCRMRSNTDIAVAADLAEFVASLRGMSRLETIKLDGEVPVSASPVMENEAVELPYLKLLQVPLEEAFVVGLLACLRIPQAAVRNLTYVSSRCSPRSPLNDANGNTIGVDLLNLLTGVPVWALSWEGRRVSLSYYNDPPRQTQVGDVMGNRVLVGWSDAMAASPPRFIINCTTNGPFTSTLLSALDLRALQLLSVSAGYARYRDWVDVFGHMSQVVTLRVEGDCAFGLGAVLARWKRPGEMDARLGRDVEATDSDDDLSAHNVRRTERADYVGYGEASGTVEEKGYETWEGLPLPLPNLRRIEIVGVDFPREDSKSPFRCSSFTPQLRWILNNLGDLYGFDAPGFVKGLRARVERGAAQVERVDFERCQCAERERLAPVVAAVQEVWWERRRLTMNHLGPQEPYEYECDSEDLL
ncbi:hypothetical protein GY45DRAFT_1299054 [Cubamyces sp. BRFM 1775]|nr:hypothetical protein GY45DRAFT_1299054 [Cubamyces sp. BRFM 1775]